ncbi:MAG: glycoside hydrolase family 97 catalytic domain-containing protein [Alistipes sp.]|nr:glycoside hydrolase family 97 catalytic domain-containing protein [Alistipes sp.]
MLKKLFGFDRASHSVRTEIMAGITIFLTMSYILAVNPDIFSKLDMPGGAVFTSTALAAIVGCFAMAFWGKLPFGLAPGMGLNAFFVYTVCLGMGYHWSFALTAVFLEGLLFILLTVTNVREAIVNAIPTNLRYAIGAGIGLFIAFIGLQHAGIIVDNGATLVTLGEVTEGPALLGIIGLFITGVMYVKGVRGAMLFGVLITMMIGIPMGITQFRGVVSTPSSIEPIFCQFQWESILSLDMLVVVFTFLFIDMFDTVGTLIGVCQRAGMVNKDGRIERLNQAFMADAIATTAGAMLGTSTTTTYVESAAGVAQGGRTGLTAFTVGCCFVVALFFSPLFLSIPSAATAPVLIIVGLLMLEPIKNIDFSDYTESIPAFVCIILMPLSYSISDGILIGMICYVVLNILCGKFKKISIPMYILAALFILKYIFIVVPEKASAEEVVPIQQETMLSVSSPDGRTTLAFDLNDKGEAVYMLQFGDEEIVSSSRLGLDTSVGDFTTGLTLAECSREAFNETWRPVWGQFAEIENSYNELSVTLENTAKQQMVVTFRLYDDGLALRYTLPGEGECDIYNERTEFRMADNYEVHWMAGSDDDAEFDYLHTTLDGITPKAMKESSDRATDIMRCGVATPVAMKTAEGSYVAIHEAALWDYPGMALAYDANSRTFTSELSGNNEVKSHNELGFSTPWRVVVVGDRIGTLVETSIILNLNEPSKLDDTSWIKPMKYVGVWWEMHLKESIWDMDGQYPHSATTANVKRYIDFAAENGFGGVLVEGWNEGWGRGERFDYTKPYPDFDIEELTRYAAERGVEIIGHHETYANVENYDQQMEAAYDYYERFGINSVKTGYVGSINGRNHYDQSMVEHYNRTVVLASEHKLCVDIHEPIHSTGICRTYPNLMSAEGMRGQEWHAWNAGNCIDHNPTLPFTRNLAGPMDFTPGIFDLRYHNTINKAAATADGSVNKEYDYTYYVNSTLAHQLAQYVVFYSPIQMVADLPENYREHDDALAFIREVPVDWATTRCLDGEIGDYCITARRDKHSDNWYVGGITDGQRRSVTLAFDFLDAGRKYEATIYRDGENAGWNATPTDYVIETLSVDSTSTLDITMAEGGGFAISIKAL